MGHVAPMAQGKCSTCYNEINYHKSVQYPIEECRRGAHLPPLGHDPVGG